MNTQTVDVKTLTIPALAAMAASAMIGKGKADQALVSIQQQQKEAAAMLAASVRETKRRKITLPARVNANSKGEGAELIRTMRELFVDAGLAPGTVNNYLTGFREAVAGKRDADKVKENKARADADKAPGKVKGADEKNVTKASISIGKGTTADEFAVVLLGVLESRKGVDWSILTDAVKDALSEIAGK